MDSERRLADHMKCKLAVAAQLTNILSSIASVSNDMVPLRHEQPNLVNLLIEMADVVIWDL